MKQDWEIKQLGEICNLQLGKTPARGNEKFWDLKLLVYTHI